MKRKRIFIVSITIIILIAIIVGINIIKQKKVEKTLKEIATFYGCEYVKETNSTEKGYRKELYWNYNVPPVDEEETYKEYYEEVLNAISGTIKNNYILIDNTNSIKIKIIYNKETNKIIYVINDDTNYFNNEQNRQTAQMQKNTDENIIELNIASQELADTISNDWSRKKSERSYGTKTNTQDGYDIYSNGIKVKTVNSKVFNLIFSTEYKGNVFENIKTNMDKEEIKKVLGDPTFENIEATAVIGYKTENYYVFFYKGEISIYPIEQYSQENNEKFADLVTNYINDTSTYKEFVQKVTELYPDYLEYVQNDDNIDLKYPLKGLEIKIGNNIKSGIYIYSNYQGFITKDVEKEDLSDKTLKNVYLVNNDFIFETEQERAANNNK